MDAGNPGTVEHPRDESKPFQPLCAVDSGKKMGNTVGGALNRFKVTGDPIAGSTEPESAGNGSLMRLAPVAIRYWDNEDARRDAAARQSRTTHGASEAVDACIAFADMLADAIAGKPRGEVTRDRLGDPPFAGEIANIMSGLWRGKARRFIL